jgi:23S rRNA pseudouridine1911/1915/1917 synthase
MIETTIDKARDGETLAAIVRVLLDGTPWSKARDLCTSGRVTIDGERALDPAMRVRRGMKIAIHQNAPRLRAGVLERERIVHIDDDVVVIDKPAGVITVPFEEDDRDTLVDQTRALLKRMDKSRVDPMLGVVQRLDKDTTGVIVFARNMSAKRSLEEQIRAHDAGRRYHAIVYGKAYSGKRESYIMQDRGDGLRGSWGTRKEHHGNPPGNAKHAVTHLVVLEALKDATLIECRLETGRQHQIRIHMSEGGHPIIGETVYVRDFRGLRFDAPRPMLHAIELAFDHPRSGERVTFTRPPPTDFQRCLASLR